MHSTTCAVVATHSATLTGLTQGGVALSAFNACVDTIELQ